MCLCVPLLLLRVLGCACMALCVRVCVLQLGLSPSCTERRFRLHHARKAPRRKQQGLCGRPRESLLGTQPDALHNRCALF